MNEDIRKEFEEFWKKNMSVDVMPLHKTAYPFMLDEKQQYLCHETNRSWITWQASREAMKPIKLPVKMKNTEAAECYYYNDAIDECKEAIEQAGYKAEP